MGLATVILQIVLELIRVMPQVLAAEKHPDSDEARADALKAKQLLDEALAKIDAIKQQ